MNIYAHKYIFGWSIFQFKLTHICKSVYNVGVQVLNSQVDYNSYTNIDIGIHI